MLQYLYNIVTEYNIKNSFDAWKGVSAWTLSRKKSVL